jgi:hypothetical protein
LECRSSVFAQIHWWGHPFAEEFGDVDPLPLFFFKEFYPRFQSLESTLHLRDQF